MRCIALLLAYPDQVFFKRIPDLRICIEQDVRGFANPVLHLFLDELEALGPSAAEEAYLVASMENLDAAAWLARQYCHSGNGQGYGQQFLSDKMLCTTEPLDAPDVFGKCILQVIELFSGYEEQVAFPLLGRYMLHLAKLEKRLEHLDCLYVQLLSLAVDVFSRACPAGGRKAGEAWDAACLNGYGEGTVSVRSVCFGRYGV